MSSVTRIVKGSTSKGRLRLPEEDFLTTWIVSLPQRTNPYTDDSRSSNNPCSNSRTCRAVALMFLARQKILGTALWAKSASQGNCKTTTSDATAPLLIKQACCKQDMVASKYQKSPRSEPGFAQLVGALRRIHGIHLSLKYASQRSCKTTTFDAMAKKTTHQPQLNQFSTVNIM